jgi:hypothetical protein
MPPNASIRDTVVEQRREKYWQRHYGLADRRDSRNVDITPGGEQVDTASHVERAHTCETSGSSVVRNPRVSMVTL